jgi:hypothetical protein
MLPNQAKTCDEENCNEITNGTGVWCRPAAAPEGQVFVEHSELQPMRLTAQFAPVLNALLCSLAGGLSSRAGV